MSQGWNFQVDYRGVTMSSGATMVVAVDTVGVNATGLGLAGATRCETGTDR